MSSHPTPPNILAAAGPVDTYTFSHLHSTTRNTPSSSILSAIRAATAAASLPDIAVSPSQGKFLQLHARAARAKHILEIGTLGGYSAVWLAHAGEDVRVTSIEVNEHHATVARSNIALAGLERRVSVRVGAGLDVLGEIAKEVGSGGQNVFDMAFIDADKENNWAYVDTLLGGLVKSGATIVVDNVVRQGRVAQEGGDSRVMGAKRVVEMVGRDERIDGVVMQTVGDKSYDGFLFAVVR